MAASIAVFNNPMMGRGRPAYLSVVSRERTYVIGFRRKDLADHVYRRIHPTRLPDLRHQKIEDVTDEFNQYMQQSDPNFKVMHLQMDMEAVLTIPKHTLILNKGDIHETYDKEHVDEARFLMYPFEKYLGVAIPQFIEREEDDYIHLRTLLIDPCDSPTLFVP